MAACLGLLAKTFGRAIDEELIAIYDEALSDITPDQIENVAKHARRECKFFPRPKELREIHEKINLTPIRDGQSPDRDASGKYIPLLDSVPSDRMLAAIEAVSSRYAGDEAMTTELARMEKDIRKRRQADTPNEVER